MARSYLRHQPPSHFRILSIDDAPSALRNGDYSFVRKNTCDSIHNPLSQEAVARQAAVASARSDSYRVFERWNTFLTKSLPIKSPGYSRQKFVISSRRTRTRAFINTLFERMTPATFEPYSHSRSRGPNPTKRHGCRRLIRKESSSPQNCIWGDEVNAGDVALHQ